MKKFISAKLHGIYVTESELNYHGSITLDPEHCERVGILPMEFVDIWNKNSGARISTYVIYGTRGSRCCILNGAAARTCQVGDQIIICSSTYIIEEALIDLSPHVLTFNLDNSIHQELEYKVTKDNENRYEFHILDGHGLSMTIPVTTDIT